MFFFFFFMRRGEPKKVNFYPKVPMTRVSTPRSPSGCHLAKPKSPT